MNFHSFKSVFHIFKSKDLSLFPFHWRSVRLLAQPACLDSQYPAVPEATLLEDYSMIKNNNNNNMDFLMPVLTRWRVCVAGCPLWAIILIPFPREYLRPPQQNQGLHWGIQSLALRVVNQPRASLLPNHGVNATPVRKLAASVLAGSAWEPPVQELQREDRFLRAAAQGRGKPWLGSFCLRLIPGLSTPCPPQQVTLENRDVAQAGGTVLA